MDWFAKSNYYNLVPICLVNEDMGLCIRVPSTPSLIIQRSKFNSNTFIHYCSTLIWFAPSNILASWILVYLQIEGKILKITKNIFPPMPSFPNLRRCSHPRCTSRPCQEKAESGPIQKKALKAEHLFGLTWILTAGRFFFVAMQKGKF